MLILIGKPHNKYHSTSSLHQFASTNFSLSHQVRNNFFYKSLIQVSHDPQLLITVCIELHCFWYRSQLRSKIRSKLRICDSPLRFSTPTVFDSNRFRLVSSPKSIKNSKFFLSSSHPVPLTQVTSLSLLNIDHARPLKL